VPVASVGVSTGGVRPSASSASVSLIVHPSTCNITRFGVTAQSWIEISCKDDQFHIPGSPVGLGSFGRQAAQKRLEHYHHTHGATRTTSRAHFHHSQCCPDSGLIQGTTTQLCVDCARSQHEEKRQ
jgi:hypothetical protein